LDRSGLHELIKIKAGQVELEAALDLPKDPMGVVLFAHGSGSGRLSVRNNYVAGVLLDAGIGTLLFDLLTPEEAADRRNVFDIELLSRRMLAATSWVSRHAATKGVKIGYFGASTGAAAALVASVATPERIEAIVSRGGRPDMAMDVLDRVKAPTLLIVGGDDDVVLGLNREAFSRLKSEKELKVVPGATHLFEEEGKMEIVGGLAKEWFVKHFTKAK